MTLISNAVNKFLILAILSLVAASCDKPEEMMTEVMDDCAFGLDFFLSDDLSMSSSSGWNRDLCPDGITFEAIGNAAFSAPIYNPIDENMIVYSKKELSEELDLDTKLILFDFCSGQETILDQAEFLGEQDWRGDGWIYYLKNLLPYRVRPDGGVSQRINIPNGISQLTWNGAGNKVAFNRYTPTDKYVIIADEFFNPIDTIQGIFSASFAWGKNDQLALVYGDREEIPYGIYIYDNLDKSVEFVEGTSSDLNISVIDWGEDRDDILWFAGGPGAIFKTDMITGTTTNLQTDSGVFKSPSFSPSGEYIIGLHQNSIRANDCVTQSFTELMLYDVNTGVHKKIDLEK